MALRLTKPASSCMPSSSSTETDVENVRPRSLSALLELNQHTVLERVVCSSSESESDSNSSHDEHDAAWAQRAHRLARSRRHEGAIFYPKGQLPDRWRPAAAPHARGSDGRERASASLSRQLSLLSSACEASQRATAAGRGEPARRQWPLVQATEVLVADYTRARLANRRRVRARPVGQAYRTVQTRIRRTPEGKEVVFRSVLKELAAASARAGADKAAGRYPAGSGPRPDTRSPERASEMGRPAAARGGGNHCSHAAAAIGVAPLGGLEVGHALSERARHLMQHYGVHTCHDLELALQRELSQIRWHRERNLRLVTQSRVKHVKALRLIFDSIDEDGSGHVGRFQFRDYLMRVERAHPDSALFAEAESIFSTLDADRTGLIEFHELLKLWYPYLNSEECVELAKLAPTSHEQPQQELGGERTWRLEDVDNMRRHFLAMDRSGDGQLDQLEFEQGMMELLMAQDVSKKARKECHGMVSHWFKEIDKDGSGIITFKEFLAWYMSSVSDYTASEQLVNSSPNGV